MQTQVGNKKGRRYMMAMVLGTALTAIGAQSAEASPAQEIAPGAIHDITRYCTTCWRNARLPADRWSDCTQEFFRRLLGSIPAEGWSRVLATESEERREFMRAIDAVKKRTQRDARRNTNLVGVVSDNRDSGLNRRADERDAVAHAAENLLSPRQKRILQMSFEGWSVQDMADDLSVPVERVSDEKYKAIRKLREHFCQPSRG
jgi:RNA polymerase sigma factor (sigma-70 family)